LLEFLKPHQPAGVLNVLGGLGAQLLIHAELNGISAVVITAILDSHYVTSETLQAFSSVVNKLLDLPSIKMDEIHRFKAFKEVLKEENSRGHNIFN
jgi:hypothetical protein